MPISSEFSVGKNLDDYTLCFPESDQLFNKLIRENKIRVYRLILEERNNRMLDCSARFNEMLSAEKNLNNLNNIGSKGVAILSEVKKKPAKIFSRLF